MNGDIFSPVLTQKSEYLLRIKDVSILGGRILILFVGIRRQRSLKAFKME